MSELAAFQCSGANAVSVHVVIFASLWHICAHTSNGIFELGKLGGRGGRHESVRDFTENNARFVP